MKHNDRFEQAWQSAEARNIGQHVLQGYPAWLARRRQTRRLALGALAVVLVVAATLPWLLSAPASSTAPAGAVADRMYCNRTTHPADHWARVADEMLALQTT